MAASLPIAPYVTLRDLTTGLVVAATSRVLAGWELSYTVNAPGALIVPLSVAEQGEGPQAVADVLLLAVGGPDGQQAPRPILLEFSLDGGAQIDAALLVRSLTQDASKLQVTVSGPQVGALYGQRYLEKTPYPLVALADALGAPAGSIPVIRTAPDGTQIYGVLGTSGTYPFLAGIFQRVVGPDTWAGRTLLHMIPVLDQGVAWQQVTERSYADTMLKALDLICQKLTSDVASAVGHFVMESCSPALSLSARMVGIVTGGTTRPSRQKPGHTSDQLGGVRNAIVVGYAGSTPTLTFDGMGSSAPPEDQGAVLLTSRLQRTPDTSGNLAEVSMTGGSTRAGLPDGGKITRLTCLHRTRAGWPHPAWVQANLPLVAVYGSERVGGLYTTFEDGRLHPVGPAVGITDLATDDLRGMLYIATDDGVYRHSTNVLATSEPWVKVGNLTGKVRRLQVVVLNVSPYPGSPQLESYVFCHISGSGPERDGLYRHDTSRGKMDLLNYLTSDETKDLTSGIGDDQWTRLLPSEALTDFCCTDHHSVYFLDQHDLTRLHYFDYFPPPGGLNQPPTQTQTTDYALLGGASGTRLDRVVTVAAGGHGAADSIFIGTRDDGYGLQIYGVGGDVGGLHYGNADHSLSGPDGQPLIVQRCVGLGIAVDHEYLAVMACTSLGLYVADDLSGTNWKPVGEDGLAGYSILDVAAGQTQQLASTDGIQRFYAATESDLLISNSQGDWWEPLGEGSKVELTTYFVDLARHLLGTYPDNDLLSIGPADDMYVAKRLVHKSTAKQTISPLLAPTLQWERRLDDEQGWVTWLTDTASASTNQSMEQVTEIQTDALISDTEAAQALAALTVRQFQEANEPITALTLGSRFTTQGALLRSLKPTEAVAAEYVGEIAAWDSSGNVVSTTWMDLGTLPNLYVLTHTLRGKERGVCETETDVSTSLRTRRLGASDWAASMMQRLKAVALHRTART